MNLYPNSPYPPGVSQSDIDESAGLHESLEDRLDREAEKGDMERDREVDNE